MEFDFRQIEQKWRKDWEDKAIYKVTEDTTRPKYYVLDMFPYPSGAGLHVGHPLGYVASDIYARYKRLKGFNVLHPMGYDAFGLPAEQYAIETGTPPEVTTEKAIKTYREQLDKIGFSYDWSRQVKTCGPQYYKWTQWIFLQLFGSWYNREKNKAESIETLIARFESEGCTGWAQHDKNDHAEFTAADWKQFSTEQQQTILMNYRIAYQSYSEVNWCEALGTVLANDEVKDGKSERGGYPVERRKMRQWFLRITEYADRLLEGLERLDWSDAMKDMQRNWIGRSEGALVKFKVGEGLITVFTTRPDTIFGATFMVIAPEHELVASITTPDQQKEIDDYIAYVKSRTDVERQQEKRVTGAFTGSYATNPFTGAPIPIYIAEYVLAGYGTGAIMAVPADDERDRKFAEKFGLPVIEVIDKSMYPGATIEDKVGKMINSDFLNGMEVRDAIKAIIDRIEVDGLGKRQVNYRLRDAGYSRQRYWGEPFPIVYKNDIPYPLPITELPVELPSVTSYKPTGDGRAPLANSAEWINHAMGTRETDTMPGYAGSSWYFLRYMDPNNADTFAAKDKIDYWQNVDLYLGGSEHAVGHLLYSRLWHKFLYDMGYVPTDEPFKKLVNQGMIQGVSYYFNSARVRYGSNYVDTGLRFKESSLQKYNQDFPDFKLMIADSDWTGTTEDGERFVVLKTEVEKMSKSKYNVVNPDDVIEKYGADAFRMFEMFLGPLDQSKPWDDKGINGVSNFLRKFWRLFYDDKGWRVTDDKPSDAEYKALHKTLKKIAEDIERLQFNTCVSQFMICVNELNELRCTKRDILRPLVIALAPFAPFITEELWAALGNKGSVHQASYPAVEEKYLVESAFNYPVSINGKVRANIPFDLSVSEQDIKAAVLSNEAVTKWTNGAEPKKFIFVKGKIINVVV
jgi:leucyl-tRNA synthetase